MESFYYDSDGLESCSPLYLDGHLFLNIWEVYCYFVEYVSYAFSLHLFLFNFHDS
jgi:hypothetical protein